MITFSFIIFFTLLIAGVYYSTQKERKAKLIGLKSLSQGIGLTYIPAKQFSEHQQYPALKGVFNDCELKVEFRHNSNESKQDRFLAEIKIRLGCRIPYRYTFKGIPTVWDENFSSYFSASSSEPGFNQLDRLSKTKNRLKAYHHLLNEGSICIYKAALIYVGPNFLKTDKEVEQFHQLLQVLTDTAKDFQEYFRTYPKRFPYFTKLMKQMQLSYCTIGDSNYKNILAKQTSILSYAGELHTYPLRACLYEKNARYQAVFEIDLLKKLDFSLDLFSERKNSLLSLFKGQDIKIRDEEFDQAFVIQSNDQLKTKQILVNQDFRELLLELNDHQLKWSLSGNRLFVQLNWDSNRTNNMYKLIHQSFKLYQQI